MSNEALSLSEREPIARVKTSEMLGHDACKNPIEKVCPLYRSQEKSSERIQISPTAANSDFIQYLHHRHISIYYPHIGTSLLMVY